MALDADAGPRVDSARCGTGLTDASREWSNVRPLERSAAGAVGQWIELLASISHELRTPLNAVIGFSDAMQQEVFGPIGNARYREYVGHIRTSGVELLQAAEDALAMTAVLAQPRSSTPTDVPLAQLVADAIGSLGIHDREDSLAVEVNISDDIEVRADGRILARAVRQLIALARSRATPASRLSISARAEHGQVELLLVVMKAAAGTQAPGDLRATSSHFEHGLGRRELSLWLAVALLDLLDCRLGTDQHNGTLSLRTTLEQSRQGSFFPVGSLCHA